LGIFKNKEHYTARKVKEKKKEIDTMLNNYRRALDDCFNNSDKDDIDDYYFSRSKIEAEVNQMSHDELIAEIRNIPQQDKECADMFEKIDSLNRLINQEER
jgi:hypothetical protein